MALDQGTTSSRAIIFDQRGEMVSVAQRPFNQYFPKPGWVEHDGKEIWASQVAVLTEALAKSRLDAADIQAIGVTNQRETTLVWDRATGEPIHNAIVWQDRRTAKYCDQIREEHGARIQEKTGLVLDAISRPPRSSGCWTTCPAPARRPNGASCASARWTPG